VQNRTQLIPLLTAVTCTRSTADWTQLLEDKAVPCGPINDLAQAFADPQVLARNLILNQPLALIDKAQPASNNEVKQVIVKTVASPLRLTATPPVVLRAPPSLGQHTDEVLAELGLSAANVAALRQRGVV